MTELIDFETTANNLLRIQLNYKKDGEHRKTISYFGRRIDEITELWTKFSELDLFVRRGLTPELMKLQEKRFIEVRNVYEELMDTFHDKREKLMAATSHTDTKQPTIEASQQPFCSQLERIKIPKFSGVQEDWQSFKDLFESLVHSNATMSDVQKMHYLKTNLEGNAAASVKHFQITNANYPETWKILCSEYDNPWAEASNLMSRFLYINDLKSNLPSTFRNAKNTLNEMLGGLKAINVKTDSWDPLLISILIKKMDLETHKEWRKHLGASKQIPKLTTMKDFIEFQIVTLESGRKTDIRTKTFSNTSTSMMCIICDNSKHNIYTCKQFLKFTHNDRINKAVGLGLCHNCLKPGHQTSECFSKYSCAKCKGHHHTLIHPEEQCASNESVDEVILPTATVHVQDQNGHLHSLRALLDQGSQRSFITEQASTLLGLKRTQTTTQVSGINTREMKTNGLINLAFKGRISANWIKVHALVLPAITSYTATNKGIKGMFPEITSDHWADQSQPNSLKIDVLFGSDIYGHLLETGIKKRGQITAQNTKLGWITSGNPSQGSYSTICNHINTTGTSIAKQVKQFWSNEEYNTNSKRTVEDKYAETHFELNTKIDQTGRFEVRLPFKPHVDPTALLGSSRNRALSRFYALENRLEKQPDLHSEYKKFIHEYIRLGHMSKVPNRNIHQAGTFYFPHHAVIKPESSSTKLRVVFDGSCQTTTGISLNDVLCTGPSNQNSLANILMRWRMHKYVVRADIKQMFRQIKVNESDQVFQRILWRDNSQDHLNDYQLTTVTYGTACASFLATRVLQSIAENSNIPIISEIIRADFYMDDLMTGCNSICKLQSIVKYISDVLQESGLPLRKYAANNPQILEGIPADHIEMNVAQLDPDEFLKTLGVYWNPIGDFFTFKVKVKNEKLDRMTKRQVLSEIASVFDPIGWLQPVVVIGKMMMQELWLLKGEWDDQLPAEFIKRWTDFRDSLTAIEMIKIERWIKTQPSSLCQLHGFCDASKKACAAVVYLRTTDESGQIQISLIAAKTKVSPLKPVTIPRLELSAANLLVTLLKQITYAYNFKFCQQFLWSDSTIALTWIKTNSKLNTYVSNRVTQINNWANADQWRYVPSQENPADCASRGLTPERLINHTQWWHGPDWLKTEEENWPDLALATIENEGDNDAAKPVRVTLATVKHTWLISEFSSFGRLRRVLGYVLRFINNCRNKQIHLTSHLSIAELNRATLSCIRIAQSAEFENEIKLLTGQSKLPSNSVIGRLNPHLDRDNILRVTGRIQGNRTHTNNPAILGSKNPISRLIIDEYHRLTVHGGAQLVHATIRRNYWIVNGINTVKQEIRKCMICAKFNTITSTQLMGSLPNPRTTATRPFLISGLDFAGPINIKWNHGRGVKTIKAYIAIFVCFSTKAVHIELVTDLTAQTCIAAIMRFAARRGRCQEIYSDNGTNFVGAAAILTKQTEVIARQEQEALNNQGISWKFIPPSSPHMGGLWEAGVKSMKRHLEKVLSDHILTYEELITILHQIEACMNSRPLTAISDDPTDLEALTPAHFLIGEPIISSSHHEYSLSSLSLNQRWALVQQLKTTLWKRWHNEYLNRLQQRTKWRSTQPNIKVGDLVLVKERNWPTNKQPLGRIMETHPGEDGLVRIVTVRTAAGTYKRPVVKICLLPGDNDLSWD